jgi:hypothetical protein
LAGRKFKGGHPNVRAEKTPLPPVPILGEKAAPHFISLKMDFWVQKGGEKMALLEGNSRAFVGGFTRGIAGIFAGCLRQSFWGEIGA